MIVGVLGNVTVLIHTIFSNKEKTATSYLAGNLAMTDLLVCLTFYPIWIIEFIQTMLNVNSDLDFPVIKPTNEKFRVGLSLQFKECYLLKPDDVVL